MKNQEQKEIKENLIKTMTCLFGLTEEDELQIKNLMDQHGVRDFFMNIEAFDLSQRTCTGLMNLQKLILAIENHQTEPVDEDEGIRYE
jgi:Na+-transporting methylmalonyl-CoA/oxaloacetate decarboxylase beta subunit